MTEVSPLGRMRAAAVDAEAGLDLGQDFPGIDAQTAAWARQQLALDPAVGLSGVAIASIPAPWRPVLAAAGVPLATGTTLSWDLVREDAGLTEPRLLDGQLTVPSLPVMAGLTSLPLRDLREWVCVATGVRVRLPTGVRLWLGKGRAILVNLTNADQAGFLHGPLHGMRAGITLEPGGFQVLTW